MYHFCNSFDRICFRYVLQITLNRERKRATEYRERDKERERAVKKRTQRERGSSEKVKQLERR